MYACGVEIAEVLLLSVGAGVIGGALAMTAPRVRTAVPTWVWPAYWIALGLVLAVAGIAWWLDWR